MELTFRLDAENKLPLYEQLLRYIKEEIQRGRIREGEKLPSKRSLCQHLHISRVTVETAYGVLLAEGYIRSVPKSGYYVEPMVPMPKPPPRLSAAPESKPEEPAYCYDFSTSAVDTSVFPYATWAKIFKETLYERPELLQRGDPQGDEELRQTLCEFLYQYRGVNCRPEQMVIGAGLETLMDMLLQLLPAHAAIALEDPGYAASYRIMENHGKTICPIPVDEQGIRTDALEKSRALVACVTPSHQFPMGAAMPAGRRTQLLSWAGGGAGRLIIEDDYDSEFRYASRPLPALQGMSDGQGVVYTGTFSRSIAPSIRVAYMVLPPRLLPAYRRRFGASSSTVSRFEQQTLYRFIAGGHYGRHLRRVGNLYKSRCAVLTQLLTASCGMEVRGCEAGLHLLAVHPRLPERELVSRAAGEGVKVTGLSRYSKLYLPTDRGVVLGFAGLTAEEIRGAAQRLQAAWR